MWVSELPRSTHTRAWVVVGILALGGSLGGYLLHLQRTRAELTKRTTAPAVPVAVTVVERRDVPIELAGIGTVQAYNTVTVKPLVGGQIVKIAFTEGQRVRPGEVLAQIDSRFLTAQLHQAQATRVKDEAQLNNAKRDLARLSDVAVRGYVSRQQLDTQQAQVAVLDAAIAADQAAIENARVQVDYATVTAPIEGVTGLRLVDVGNVITPSDPGIVVITQIDPIAVIFTLPADVLGSIPMHHAQAENALAVDVFDRDDRVRLATGTLAVIDNEIDRNTNTVRLKAVVDNTNGALRPGQFVIAHLRRTVVRGAVIIPSRVIQYDEEGPFAWLVRADSTVEPRRIMVGPTNGDFVTVHSGLASGDRVVLDGQYNLRRGAAVLVRTGQQVKTSGSTNALTIP